MSDLTGRSLGRRATLASIAAFSVSGCASSNPEPNKHHESLVAQLRETELAFAATMARRNLDAFAAFLAKDAVFIGGGKPLRGTEAIVNHWKRYFTAAQPPFSWRPEIVEVAGDGRLGCTEGPVLSTSGVVFARFCTTWQRSPTGGWLVVFDSGYSVCAPNAAYSLRSDASSALIP